MLLFCHSRLRSLKLPEGFRCSWNRHFYLILSAACTLLVLVIDHARIYTIPIQTALVSGLYLILGVFLSLLLWKIKELSCQYVMTTNTMRCDGNERMERVERNTHGRFLISMSVLILILISLLSRSVAMILIPFNKAQSLYDADRTMTGLVASFIPESDTEAAFSNPYLTGTAVQTGKVEPEYQTVIIRTSDGMIFFYCQSNFLEYGDRIQVNLHLTQPSPARNPGGFDKRRYYSSNGIYLKGTLINSVEPVVIQAPEFSVTRTAYSARSKILRIFAKNLPPGESGLMAGLLLGDRSGMSKDDLEYYQKAGLSHITAVSGSAITFLLVPLEAVLKKTRLAKKWKSCFIVIVLLFFGFLTGWTPSISRALIMVFILLAARMLHQKIQTTQALFLAIPVLLSISPVFALNIGFWLSCLATAGIVRMSRSILKKESNGNKDPSRIRSALSMSIAAGISVLPLIIWFSKEISLSSIISGVLVLPLVEFTTILGSIEAMLGWIDESCLITRWLAIPLKGLLYSINRLAAGIAGIEFLRFRTAGLSFYFILAISAFLLYLLMTEKKKKRICLYAGICLLATAGIHTGISWVLAPEIQIVFADVGQGDSTLIRLKTGEAILIDSGGMDKGYGVMSRMLDYYSIRHPSIYIATHTHEDHCGAMTGLIRERSGTTLMVPWNTISQIENHSLMDPTATAGGESEVGAELLQAAREEGMAIREIGMGDIIVINKNLKMTIYNPKKDVEGPKLQGNQTSLVIKLDTPRHKVLIMGDATGDVEQELVDSRQDISANIYRISHHGSPSSTNHDIISAVSPRVSIVSVGKNFYGHPSPKVIQRLVSAGSDILRTDENGAILIDIDKEKMVIHAMIP